MYEDYMSSSKEDGIWDVYKDKNVKAREKEIEIDRRTEKWKGEMGYEKIWSRKTENTRKETEQEELTKTRNKTVMLTSMKRTARGDSVPYLVIKAN